MTTFAFNIHAPCWHPEGSTLAIEGGGVRTSGAPFSSSSRTKHDGSDLPRTTALQMNRNSQQHRKKAYIRALKRATLHGMTSVSATHEPPTYSSPSSQNRRPSVRFRQNRVSFFSWNIGQLNLSKWDLFRAWLHQQPIDCACLQDVGWQFTGEWKEQQFSYIHSGAQHHRGGLLTIARTDFCSDHNIAWTTPMESRIQHIRLYKHTYSIDILNLYQTIKALPKRNCWIIGGDLYKPDALHQLCWTE